MYNILDNYKSFYDIKGMSYKELDEFSREIREFLIDKVSKTGGHLASNLGVVELTLSLYYVFDFNKDKIIWDVGHQSYVHKILTGRKDRFDTLRKFRGMSGFPSSKESKYDMFETGHSSTSISAALGMARARDIKNEDYNVIAVIGDGALTGGLAFEALNDAGYRKTKLIVVLNDNQMSICKNVGGMSKYLNKIRTDPAYNRLKRDVKSKLNRTDFGKGIAASLEKIKGSLKQFVLPKMLFEDMGIKYLGPVDGHNIKELNSIFQMAKNLTEPVIIHVITKKGKGYNYAEEAPDKFHGIGPFDCKSGEVCISSRTTYSSVFGDEMVQLGEKRKDIVAITAAMRNGTGLTDFSQKYKDRFFDVGIAEEHAVTLAAGMAKAGLTPVFAVYSTFLQRAYDEILNDVCRQKLHVVFAVDRAGIVGEDGETHQGIFDISYLSSIPNIIIMSPKCMEELRYMLRWAVDQKLPVAIRYPKGSDYRKIEPLHFFTAGKWEVLFKEGHIAVIACGKMVQKAIKAREKLLELGIKVTIVNACFIKPIDRELIKGLVDENFDIVTVEDNVIHGGLGSAVNEYINSLNKKCTVMNMGYDDRFIPHGDVEILYKEYSLDSDSIVKKVKDLAAADKE